MFLKHIYRFNFYKVTFPVAIAAVEIVLRTDWCSTVLFSEDVASIPQILWLSVPCTLTCRTPPFWAKTGSSGPYKVHLMNKRNKNLISVARSQASEVTCWPCLFECSWVSALTAIAPGPLDEKAHTVWCIAGSVVMGNQWWVVFHLWSLLPFCSCLIGWSR